MTSYAGVPVAEQVEGDLYRIYFTSRDPHSRSHVGWVELDITRPERILQVSEAPILSPGEAGRFDDAGTTLSSLVAYGGRRYFYYIGWSLRKSVPYHLAIGLALADGGTAVPTLEQAAGPIIDRNPIDPLFCTAPTVLVQDGRWRMWYVSGLGWPKVDAGVTPSYRSQYAESEDGIDWHRTGRVVLDPQNDEYGFSRASILFDERVYQVWYSIRGRKQPSRLGYARSLDGLVWTRSDGEATLGTSSDGWDCEMIAYPYVFDHRGQRYMLYCGNGFGRTGFGIAVMA